MYWQMNIRMTRRKLRSFENQEMTKSHLLGIYFTLNITLPIMLRIWTKLKTCFCHEKLIFARFV